MGLLTYLNVIKNEKFLVLTMTEKSAFEKTMRLRGKIFLPGWTLMEWQIQFVTRPLVNR